MRTYIYENNNSKGFYNMAWIAFILAGIGMVAGLAILTASLAMKGFLIMAYLFSISSCFTVSKVVRDRHESERFINKVENAKTEKFLNEYSKPEGTPA
ncbi:MAG: YiaA/YiaB family inner membrane protein [Bacteroidota bacterium]